MYWCCRLCTLAREVCVQPVGMNSLEESVSEILESPGNSIWRNLFGGAVAAGSFALFFNGNLFDALSAAFVTLVVINICKYAINRQKNKLTPNTFAAFAMEAIIIVMAWLGLCHSIGSVTLGGTMLLISSLGLTNGFKDILHGDVLSGMMDTANAIIGALGIAIGIMLAMFLLIGTEQTEVEIMPLADDPVLGTLFCITACAGFAVMFGARGKAIAFAAAGGGITWIVYLLFYDISDGSLFEATFAGAIFVAAYSYIICRWTRIPETVFLTICVIPLLPGSFLYYTAVGAVIKNHAMFSSQGKDLILICLSISIGFVFVDVVHIYINMFRRIAKEHRHRLLDRRRRSLQPAEGDSRDDEA